MIEVTISDEREVLLAAQAAGRTVVGLWREDGTGETDFSGIRYLTDSLGAADAAYLERVVRRDRGLPWIIGETSRLRIREFTPEDIAGMAAEPRNLQEQVFCRQDTLEAYIKNQYGFYEYGIWALEEKKSGKLIGFAGVYDGENHLELGYRIFEPFRRRGYAKEACTKILDYAKDVLCRPVYAVTEADNTASIGLLKKLGFLEVTETDILSASPQCRFVWNC